MSMIPQNNAPMEHVVIRGNIKPIMLDAALEYALKGWPVIPLNWPLPSGRCSCGNPKCSKVGKHPIIENWPSYSTPDLQLIKEWWSKWPQANIGVITGEASGLLVLDVDLKDDGPETLAKLERIHGELPATVEAISGSGGRHVFFRYPKGRKVPNKSRFYEGLDTRSGGGQIAIYPSVHPSGRKYEWNAEFHPDETELAECPEWLLKLMTGKEKRNKAQTNDIILEGSRNSTLASLAGTMRKRGMSENEILAALRVTNNERCIPPLDDKEVETIAKSVARYEPGPEVSIVDTSVEQPRSLRRKFSLDAIGNSERFVYLHGENVRYSFPQKCWYAWDGARWARDNSGRVRELAKDTVKQILAEAWEEKDVDKQTKLIKWAAQSNTTQSRKNLLEDAQSIPGVPIIPERMDDQPWILNCLNGSLDLKTGKLLEHDRKHLITKLTPIEYNPEVECPTWLAFLNRAHGGKQHLIDYLQLVIGITLTGARLKKFFFVYGPKHSGKSKFIELLGKLLGEYHKGVDMDVLMTKKNATGGGPNPEIARLFGARFVAASETTETKRLNEALIKRMTGSDVMTVRTLHAEPFDFIPYHKLWIHGNAKPVINAEDEALWARLVPISFPESIPAEEQDPNLDQKLERELPGILAWALQGCLRWVESGQRDPETPAEYAAIAQEYRESMDTIGKFLDECCVTGDVRVNPKALYTTYVQWCGDNGTPPLANAKFKMKLEDRGFRQKPLNNGRFWLGIGLLEEELPSTFR